MKSRKIMYAFFVLSVTFLLVSCESKTPSSDQGQTSSATADLRSMSETVIKKMQSFASDENYHTLTGTPDEVKKILADWNKYSPDYSADILVIPISEKLISSYENPEFDFNSLNDSSKKYVIRHIASAFNSRLNSTYAGTAAIAAGSVSSYTETFRIDTGTSHNQLWLLPCTDSVGITVSFTDTGDNVVTVCASYCTVPEPENREQMLSFIFGASSFEEIGAYYLPS